MQTLSHPICVSPLSPIVPSSYLPAPKLTCPIQHNCNLQPIRQIQPIQLCGKYNQYGKYKQYGNYNQYNQSSKSNQSNQPSQYCNLIFVLLLLFFLSLAQCDTVNKYKMHREYILNGGSLSATASIHSHSHL